MHVGCFQQLSVLVVPTTSSSLLSSHNAHHEAISCKQRLLNNTLFIFHHYYRQKVYGFGCFLLENGTIEMNKSEKLVPKSLEFLEYGFISKFIFQSYFSPLKNIINEMPGLL